MIVAVIPLKLMSKFKRISLAALLLVVTGISACLGFCAYVADGHAKQDAVSIYLLERNCFLIENNDNESTGQPFILHFDDIGERLATMPVHPANTATSTWARLLNEGCTSLWIPDRANISYNELQDVIPKLRWLNSVTIHDRHELATKVSDLVRQFPDVNVATSGMKLPH